MTIERIAEGHRAGGTDFSGKAFRIYAVALLLFALVWPRYAQLPGLAVSPYSSLALLGWALVPGLLMLHPDARSRMLLALKRNGAIATLFFAWFVWRLLTSLLGQDPAFSTNEALRDIIFLLPLFPVGMLFFADKAGVEAFLRVVIIATAIAILVAFMERATGQTVGQIFGLGVSGNEAYANEMLRPSYRGGELRAKSNFAHPIVFAQFLAWVVPLLIISLRMNLGLMYNLASVACLAALPAAVWFTGTRSGLIALAAAVGMLFLLTTLQRMRLSIGAALVVLVAVMSAGYLAAGVFQDLLPDLVSGRDSTEFSSTNTRLLMLNIGLANAAHSPIIGYGDGRAALLAGNFTGSSVNATIDNFYLSTLLNNGYVGLFIMILAWGSLFLKSLYITLKDRIIFDSAVCAGIFAMLLTFSIVSITDGLAFLLISAALLFKK